MTHIKNAIDLAQKVIDDQDNLEHHFKVLVDYMVDNFEQTPVYDEENQKCVDLANNLKRALLNDIEFDDIDDHSEHIIPVLIVRTMLHKMETHLNTKSLAWHKFSNGWGKLITGPYTDSV